MNPFRRLGDLPVRLKTVFMIVVVLTLFAAGMEGFLLRYIRTAYERSAAEFARNLAQSLALAVRNDVASGNTFHVDRLFLALSTEDLQGVDIVRCVVLDESNVITADLNPETFGSKFADPDLLPLTRGQAAPKLMQGPQGGALVAAAAPIFSHVSRIGTLVLVLSMEERAREYRTVGLLSVLLTCGFILLLGVLMLYMLRDTLLRPLEEITQQAATVAAGDFDRKLALERRDEFGKLAEALESMRAGIVGDREKYRILVEGSDDIIFTMDENFHFTSGLDVLRRRLGSHRSDFSNLTLLDLLYEHPNDEGWTRAILKDKFQDFLQGSESVRHRLRIRSRVANEPLEFDLVLEHIKSGPAAESLGRLSTSGVDRLSSYFRAERQKYVIENYIAAGDEVAVRLTRNLRHVIGEDAALAVEMGLREMIINSIEHGNLAITFDEKTAAQQSGSYMAFIEQRRREERYGRRKVVVESVLTERRFACRITDEGAGFDHRAMRSRKFADVNAEMLQHGRGLLLIESSFDSIVYNEKGNQVTLVRTLSGEPREGAEQDAFL